jgi:cation transport ATPase
MMAVAVPYSHVAPNLADARDNKVMIRTVNYEIAHQVDGRMRVHIPRLSHDARFADRLVDSVSALPVVKNARVNRGTASLTVIYRQEPAGNGHGPAGSEAVLTGVIGCIRTAAKADVVRNIAPERQAPAAPQAQPAVDANYLVKQLGVPALGLGLSAALTAGVALPPALVGASIVAATIPHALRAVQGLRMEKRLTVETLDVTAVALLLAQSSFLAPAFMMAVIESAEVVRTLTARRAGAAGLDLLLPQAGKVLIERHGLEERVETSTVVPGDILLLRPGDLIVADGAVLDGSALIDEHEVTGEAAPVRLEQGDNVYAATTVLEGRLRIRAIHIGKDTRAGSILASVDAAPQTDTRVSNYARKTGNWAVLPTLAIGGAVWAISASMARAIGIVALDFGLGMRVSAPIAILAAQTRAARDGVVIRSGRAMEMLAQVDTVLFDNTSALRPESAEVIAGLRELGKGAYVASGDSRPTVRASAVSLGVDPANVYAGLLPEQKMDLVMALQAGGKKVAVVGDAANDAAAMAHADVSVTFGSANALARETADVVLTRDDLRDLLGGMRIARRALRTLKENQAIVVGTNSAGIAYGALTVLNPIAGVVLNNGVALVAALNSLRPFVLPGKAEATRANPSPTSRQDKS